MEWILIYFLAGQPVLTEKVNREQCMLFSVQINGRYMMSLRLDDGTFVKPDRIECRFKIPAS